MKNGGITNSPSAAATVINGRSATGRVEWKIQGGNITYKDWDEARPQDVSEEQDECSGELGFNYLMHLLHSFEKEPSGLPLFFTHSERPFLLFEQILI
ncbi:MAG: DUF4357 domain-containing protein [Chloroflexi bacterium]|nr:DUF4357 domain-containing protein [Chloroflexota bacterium]